MEYVSGGGGRDGCIFCDHLAADDEAASHVLWRGSGVFVLLNAFPYNTGHIMVAPTDHVAGLTELTEAQRAELMETTNSCLEVVAGAMSPQGFNVGMNLGEAGGAGIPGHLHVHVVPRWGGDTNFMTTVGDAKVLPELLDDTYRRLRPLFDELS